MVKNMRMLHLCLRLLFLGIIVTGAVSSIQVIDTSNSPTPFLIFGYVCDEDGYPSSNIIVSITNLDTSMDWQAGTEKRCNYYELVLDSGDVSAGSVLEFNITNGTACSTTNHTVNQSNFERGGILDLNLTLVSTSPVITEYAQETHVHDIENATRTFNITTSQMVNVTWLIDGREVSNESDVNESSYTHTSAMIGTWNITAITSNENDTDMQRWVWHVNQQTTTPPAIFLIYGEVFFENNTPADAPCVVITNLNTSRKFVAENCTGENFYQLITAASEIRAGDLLLINASKDGAPIGNGSVQHTVTLNESRSGVIEVNINQGWADLWVVVISTPPYIFNGTNNTITVTIANSGTSSADGFNVSLAVSTVYETVNDSVHIKSLNVGETRNITFDWTPYWIGNYTLNVTADSDGEIDESDEANNATSMTVFVGIPDFTIADLTYDAEVNLYDNVVIEAFVANYGVRDDIVEVGFYIDDNNTPFNTVYLFVPVDGNVHNATTIWNATLAANHNITARADPDNSILETDETNNSMSRRIFVDASDLTVAGVSVTCHVPDLVGNPDYEMVMFGYPNDVTARVENRGNLSADAVVELYSKLDVFYNYTLDNALIYGNLTGFHNTSNDTITQPNASKIRVHFNWTYICGYNSYVTIYDKENNTVVMPESCGWSNWADGDSIRMYAYIGSTADKIQFCIDKYEYMFANATISLAANDSTNISRIWYADPVTIANDTHSGYRMQQSKYTISAAVDPDDMVPELNESNNTIEIERDVWSPYDPAVTGITITPEHTREGEPVTIDADIKNFGRISINTPVAFYVDGTLVATKNVYAEVNKTNHISVIWDALPALRFLRKEHTITVVVDPDNEIEEIADVGGDDNNNAMSTLMDRITLLNLTITEVTTDPAEMSIGDTVEVMATIRNNENATVNSTVWFCEERVVTDVEYYVENPRTQPWTYSDEIRSHRDAPAMRVHFSTMSLGCDKPIKDNWIKVYNIDDGRLLNSYNSTTCSHGWTDWGSTAMKIKCYIDDHCIPFHFVIDKYQIPFGDAAIAIPANESVHVLANWTASWEGANSVMSTLTVLASNAANSTDVYVRGTDLAVTNISVADDLWDGDTVNITVEVTNFGGINASNFTVRFYDQLTDAEDRGVAITKRDIASLDASGSIDVIVPWTACLKVGDDVSHNHTIEVTVEPDNESVEENSTNDTGYSDTITVKRSRDFSVANITFSIGNETLDSMNLVISDSLTINATVNITNLASCDGSVNVSCYLDKITDTTLIETNRTVLFPANNGTAYAEFGWDVHVHGNHTIIVVADQGNETSEFDESNNIFNQSIRIRAPDFAVTNITFDPESPEVDGMVNITATVDNLGNEGVTNANLTIYDCYKEYTEESDFSELTRQCTFKRDAAAMRLYLGTGGVSIYDSQGIQMAFYDVGFSGWTPWVFGDCTVKVVNGGDYGNIVKVKKINYLTEYDLLHTKNYSPMPDDPANITVNRCVNTAGTHAIIAVIDPEDLIVESDESNNGLSKVMVVQGADLTVSDMQLTVDGSEVNESTAIEYGKVVNISATVANIGIRPANNFNVGFYRDSKEIANQTNLSLNINELVNVSASWNTEIGDYEIKVTADPEQNISETNESNNTQSKNAVVRGADLSITESNITWRVIPPEGAAINETGRVYDTDAVMVNATIVNEGIMPARNFSADIFYADDDATRIEDLSLAPGELMNLSAMILRVETGDHPIRVFLDPDDEVYENGKENNIADVMMQVHPSMDFVTTDLRLFHNGTEIGINDTILDGDTVLGNATLWMGINKSDPYHEYRRGTVDVEFIDEHDWVEVRISDPLTSGSEVFIGESGWVKVSPRCELTPYGYGYAQVISYPGADAMKVHFSDLNIPPHTPNGTGILFRDKNWTTRWTHRTTWIKGDFHWMPNSISTDSPWVTGDTIYIYKWDGFNYPTTYEIDRYQYRRINYAAVSLNASETKNLLTEWDNVSAWNHTMRMIIDPDDEIGEINESNNEIVCETLYVDACKDPAVVNLTFNPQEPPVGIDVMITAYVTNNGTCTASFTVDLWAEKIEYHAPEGNHGYRFNLNHTTLTLAPNETVGVTGILGNVRAGNRSINYTVHASADINNITYETDESNNEMTRILNVAVPDFTVDLHLTRDGGVRAVVRNNGFGGADDVRLFFSRSADYPLNKSGSWFTRVPKRPIQDDIDLTRIHFKELTIRYSGFLDLLLGDGNYLQYTDSESCFWTPWVRTDRIWMAYLRTLFKIDEYELAEEEFVDLAARSRRTEESPWDGYSEPYNLTVWIDPFDEVIEGNEDNNNDTMRMGADIAVSRYITVDPSAPVMGDTCYIKEIKNIGNLPTEEFDVIIFINSTSTNVTNETTFEYNTTINETLTLKAGEEYWFAWETPVVDPPDDIDYDIRIVADPEGVVKELDEDNNEISTDEPVTVYSHTNYTGGELYLYDTDWVYGGINYTIGDSKYMGGTWDDYVVNFEDVIPENVKGKDIKLARLYLYWTWGKAYSINESKFVPVPIEANVKFNDGWISEDRKYVDCPHATDNDVAWGTYAYNIPSDVVKPDNSVIVDRSPFRNKYESDPWYAAPKPFGIYGVGLLVIYESDCGMLTNYWITEGGDVIFEGANALGVEDMVTTAIFEGKVKDRDMTNATLWTVAPGGDDENALYFNKKEWENVWCDSLGVDHRCVTEHLISRDNTVELQYISGNSMMTSGAFLFVRYPPDLSVIDFTAPEYTPIGIEHSIDTTIRNNGRSDAHDFNVTFYIDGMKVVRRSGYDLPAGENMTIHLDDWTPMLPGRIYNLTVEAEVLSGVDWTEVEAENNALTKYVMIEEGGFGNQTGPRGAGGGSNPTGGEYTEKITGRVMQGMKDLLAGGGGGAGMFSLWEWIIKLVMLAACALTFGVGYWREQRRHNRKS